MLFAFAHNDRQARERFDDAAGAATRTSVKTLHDQRLADERLGDDQTVDVELVIVFGIGDGGLDETLEAMREETTGCETPSARAACPKCRVWARVTKVRISATVGRPSTMA